MSRTLIAVFAAIFVSAAGAITALVVLPDRAVEMSVLALGLAIIVVFGLEIANPKRAGTVSRLSIAGVSAFATVGATLLVALVAGLLT